MKSDQLTWNGSVFSSPAAVSTASAPVPFWSPMFSVTEDRSTELDADGLAGLDEADEDDDDDDEQPAAARTGQRERHDSIKPRSVNQGVP